MREWIDRVGKLVPKAIALGRSRTYYGQPVYKRFYGFYSLRGVSISKRIKMIRKNG